MTAKRLEILFAGFPQAVKGYDNDNFFTDKSFQDYDLVVLNPKGCIKGNFGSGYTYTNKVDHGKNAVNFLSSNHRVFENHFAKTVKQINSYLSNGGLVFVVGELMPSLIYYDDRGNKREYDLGKFLLRHQSNTDAKKGKKIEKIKNSDFDTFWKQTEGFWEYQASYTTSKDETALAHAQGAPEQIVASIHYKENGKMITIPKPVLEDQDSIDTFISALTKLHNKLSSTSKSDLPGWTSNHLIVSEREELKQISSLKEEKQKIDKNIKKKETELKKTQQMKKLFSSNGHDFETSVANALKEIGMTISSHGDGKRVDRIAEYKGKVFAIEMSGSKDKVKEGHARKVPIWVAEVEEERDIFDVKGLFIANPYMDTPLQKREMSKAWPDKAVEICKRNKTCAMSGIQLLGIWTDIKLNPEKADSIIKKIYETDGLFNGYEDFNEFVEIEIKKSEEAKAA